MLRFGSTRVRKGEEKEPMHATVRLDEGRKGGGREPVRAAVQLDKGRRGKRAHACRSLA